MDVTAATAPIPGRPNDDGYLIGPGFAVVLDGCTDPGLGSGCIHDVPWLVARLSGHLGVVLMAGADTPLEALLAEAISRTCDDHRDTCDLSHPDSPSSTVTIVRETADRLDYLALADSPLAIQHRGGDIEVVLDDQVDHLPSYTFEAVAKLRNSEGGFWVASTDPQAAYHGVAGSLPRQAVSQALLLTDGASRLVDRYDHSWSEVLGMAADSGPRSLVEKVHQADSRVAEIKESRGESVRGKRFDDATAVLCRIAD